ncbi:hypothetical protein B0T19DRAFT_430042 [Cercophora scortea]|uniref:Uncharacterized protein n=1 Tax=Cercophora scortea TaxID=314031 RepID=A0AAE0M6R2_9PEZI|nr:hypothetical protein B0T19DRAFT_430042 [Cercophora scortea]
MAERRSRRQQGRRPSDAPYRDEGATYSDDDDDAVLSSGNTYAPDGLYSDQLKPPRVAARKTTSSSKRTSSSARSKSRPSTSSQSDAGVSRSRRRSPSSTRSRQTNFKETVLRLTVVLPVLAVLFLLVLNIFRAVAKTRDPLPPPVEPPTPEEIEKGVSGAFLKLYELQLLEGENYDIVKIVQGNKGHVRRTLAELTIINSPARDDILEGPLRKFDALADNSTKGLQRSLDSINYLFGRAVHHGRLTSTALRTIHKRQTTMQTPIKYLDRLRTLLGYPPTIDAAITHQLKLLMKNLAQGLEAMQDDAMQTQHALFPLMHHVLDSVLIAVLGGELHAGEIRYGQITTKSYWKSVMKSYRKSLPDFDRRMGACATFYRDIDRANVFLHEARNVTQKLRNHIDNYMAKLHVAWAVMDPRSKAPLEKIIDILDRGVKRLEPYEGQLEEEKWRKEQKAERVYSRMEARWEREGLWRWIPW